MKNGLRLIKFMVVCLASVCLCMANDFMCEEACGDEALSGEMSSLSSSIAGGSFSFSPASLQCSFPRNPSSVNSSRTSFQTQRQNSSNSARTGFTMVKAGKSMNEYSTSLFHRSIVNFPSGMNESTHRLIGLGKLII